MTKKRYVALILFFGAGLFLVSAASLFAASTTGYAWGNTVGWINFGSTIGTSTVNVQVTTTSITGYAWSQNFGWINMSPASGGVVNDGNGNLSGYAWGQNAGWINFAGVTIDGAGVFHGIASGSVAGQIQFDTSGGCTSCVVTTTWEPATNFSPVVSAVNINGNNPATITLTANTTTNVNIEATITDNNGCSDITGGTTTVLFYRSGVTSSTCFNNATGLGLACYVGTAFTASSTCSGGVINTTTTFPVNFYAQATDASSSFPTQNWMATVIFKGASNATGTADSTNSTSSNKIATLTAINVTTSSINYGSVLPAASTGAVNQTTTVVDVGNSSTTLSVSGTSLTGPATIGPSTQVYQTSSFTYSVLLEQLTSSTTPVPGFSIPDQQTFTPTGKTLFWGIGVPPNAPSGTYSGTNSFVAVWED
jgi:hypothetical protein